MSLGWASCGSLIFGDGGVRLLLLSLLALCCGCTTVLICSFVGHCVLAPRVLMCGRREWLRLIVSLSCWCGCIPAPLLVWVPGAFRKGIMACASPLIIFFVVWPEPRLLRVASFVRGCHPSGVEHLFIYLLLHSLRDA